MEDKFLSSMSLQSSTSRYKALTRRHFDQNLASSATRHLQLLAALLSAKLAHGGPNAACNALQSALPGRVFFPGTEEYLNDNGHYTRSASESSTCSVQPESVEDVGTILQIVANGGTQSPFAIKGGGHTGNLGFSSTPGVQISMSRLNEVDYDESTSTVKIGADQIWRSTHVWFPSEVEFLALVLVRRISIGTLRLNAFPQTDVWVSAVPSHDLVLMCFHIGANNSDMKATILSQYLASSANETSIMTSLFYDGPMPPNGIFDEFLNIPGSTIRVSGTMSLPDAMETLNGRLGNLNPPRYDPKCSMSPFRDGSQQPFLRLHFYHVATICAAKCSQHRFGVPTWAIQGQSFPDDILYNNYAPADTPLELLYGDNLGRLREIKRRVDPENIMGLAAGSRLTHKLGR
ncbi:FAD-binding domain-containing protein [Moniliophthora roreri MCA 2997]|uniref:FAD-binding domain-containing protein n=1 Tax=Moniliophthora roreri (strain MCA 2997) TaxID=1381753 RepID=V2WVA9_MONRO|nr:FAD-binding domain-containing protein [Moniliophthora roreri MCA 2997]